MRIAFSRQFAEWRLCSKLCSSPLPSLSSWNCSNIRRECLMEREGKRKKRLLHTPTEWWILFGLCLLSPGLAVLVCYVGFYGEKYRPCQTPSSTRNKKKSMRKDREGDDGGATREAWFQEFGGRGITESKTQQPETICAADRKKIKQRWSRNSLSLQSMNKLSQVELK